MNKKTGLALLAIAMVAIAAAFASGGLDFDSHPTPDAVAPPAAEPSAPAIRDPAVTTADPVNGEAPAPANDGATLLVVGDSLSAGYGLESDEASWVSLLQKRLDSEGYEFEVVNASISGDTSEGGRARLTRALERLEPEIVVLELGGNDGLRGIPLEVMEQNFVEMITRSQRAGADVVLLGMRIPPNYGPRYTEAFHALYRELANRYDLPLAPFFLEDVALDPGLMQPDGIHPNEAAQPFMLERAWPAIEQALARIDTAQSAAAR